MRKSFFGVMIVALALIFTGCEKEIETSKLTLDLTKEATVRAYLYAELNNTTDGFELVPNGTKVILSIPNSSFNSSATGNWIDTAIVSNGFIEAKVPATNTGVTVTFIPAEFMYNQVQPAFSQTAQIQKIYTVTGAAKTLAVKTGEVRSIQIKYEGIESMTNFTEKVNIKFELKADIDDTNDPDYEYVPSATVVTFYNADWSATATVGEKGVVSIDAPKSKNINIRFEASKTIWVVPATVPATKETKKFRYTYSNYSTPATTEPSLKEVNCGEGIVWQ